MFGNVKHFAQKVTSIFFIRKRVIQLIFIILNPSVLQTNWNYIQEKYHPGGNKNLSLRLINLSCVSILCLYIIILINILKNESHLNHSFTDSQYVPCHILTMEHLLSGSRFIWGKVGLSNWMAWLFCLPFIVTKTYHLRLKKCYVEDSYYCTKLE